MNDRPGGLRADSAGDERESPRTAVRPFNRCVEVDSARLATRAAQER